jgi:lipopolysaccharide/colanic/teichoic acid biosynthesis glycosyltransferase
MASITECQMTHPARLAANGQSRPPVVPTEYCRWKHIPDRLLAAVLLLPAAPVLLLLVVIVRLTSPGPGIYRQVRVGRGGQTFTMYKIRTMRHDAESRTGPTWATNNDPRLTRVGAFIRSIHLDELPQLLNVVRGDMDLVGPRPERPEFTQILAREVEGYLDRLVVRPGVTGLAQINLPPDTDMNSVRRKLVLDIDYIRSANAGLDFRILCWTALRILGLKGATTGLFRLGRATDQGMTVVDSRPFNTGTSEVARDVTIDMGSLLQHGNGQSSNGAPHKHSLQQSKPR